MAHPEPYAYVKDFVKKGKCQPELLADIILRDYVDRLERENQELRDRLKSYKPGFHKNIIKKGELS